MLLKESQALLRGHTPFCCTPILPTQKVLGLVALSLLLQPWVVSFINTERILSSFLPKAQRITNGKGKRLLKMLRATENEHLN